MGRTAIELCCGRSGFAGAFLARGFDVIGFDLKPYPQYPGRLILADVRSLIGWSFEGVAVVLASPPCTEISGARIPVVKHPDLSIVEACFAIAANARAPLVLENVHRLQKFIGPAAHHWGKFYLWGDGVPPLLPAGPRWKERWKMRHRSPMLRARIPDELADAVANFYA